MHSSLWSPQGHPYHTHLRERWVAMRFNLADESVCEHGESLTENTFKTHYFLNRSSHVLFLSVLTRDVTRSRGTRSREIRLRLFHIASVSGAWEARFVAASVDESEGRPSSRFRCERCHSLIWAVTKHALLKLHWHSRCETGVKDIQIYIHAAADPERATQIVFSTTHHYFCVTDI